MKDLMTKIGFSEEEIQEVVEFVACLKEKNIWKDIEYLAHDIMSAHPCTGNLRKNLALAESWEEKAGVHKYSLDLVLLLQCTLLLKQDYIKKGMPLDLYYESMRDLTYKLQECKEIHGVTGIFVGFWYDGFFDMTRFALGRLQFELLKFPLDQMVKIQDMEVKKGDLLINMHIPSCGPLTREKTDQSFAMAKEFFQNAFEGKNMIFIMESWLLDTDLIALLPEGNIKQFVQRFQICHVEKNATFRDGWRVFGNQWKKSVDQLPRNTRLQKAIADHLQQGGKLGEGYGLLIP